MSSTAVVLFQVLGISLLVVFLISGTLSFVASGGELRRKAAIVAAISAVLDTALQGVALTVAVTFNLHLGMLIFFAVGALFFGHRARKLPQFAS